MLDAGVALAIAALLAPWIVRFISGSTAGPSHLPHPRLGAPGGTAHAGGADRLRCGSGGVHHPRIRLDTILVQYVAAERQRRALEHVVHEQNDVFCWSPFRRSSRRQDPVWARARAAHEDAARKEYDVGGRDLAVLIDVTQHRGAGENREHRRVPFDG